MSETKSTNYFKQVWNHFKEKHPALVEFLMFFLISNGVTVLQMILMPFIKFLFGFTMLVDTPFQTLAAGHNLDGSIYYVFNYAAGAISDGGGSGLARQTRRRSPSSQTGYQLKALSPAHNR